MKRLCYVICVIVNLYGLEWQKLPDVPVGRGDDIAIGYRWDGLSMEANNLHSRQIFMAL